MGFAHSEEINRMWLEVRGMIPEAQRKQAANGFYDIAGELDVDDWDGSSELEKDGNINQSLED